MICCHVNFFNVKIVMSFWTPCTLVKFSEIKEYVWFSLLNLQLWLVLNKLVSKFTTNLRWHYNHDKLLNVYVHVATFIGIKTEEENTENAEYVIKGDIYIARHSLHTSFV